MSLNEILNSDELVSLPPFVVNDVNPIMGFSENIDWGCERLNIPRIHSEFGFTGKGIVVAVIDTGVDAGHEDLKGAVIETLNTTSEPYSSSNGHGTGGSGIIGARKNDKGILSCMPDCQIISIKALTESGNGSMTDIVEAINLARSRKPHIINLSLGGGAGTPALKKAIEDAAAEGIYVVCSAGNSGSDNSVGYPAKYPQTYAVGATNKDNKISAFSSRGSEVDISAPGEKILTCWNKGGYATVSGTSFSAPYVTGCFGLLIQAGIKPSLQLLKDNAIDIEEPGPDHKSGNGLLDPYKIIKKHNMELANCAAPGLVNIVDVTERSAVVKWSPESSAFNYVLLWREKPGGFNESQPTKSTEVTLSNLKADVEYEVVIRSNCANGTNNTPAYGFRTLRPSSPPPTPPPSSPDFSKLTQAQKFIREADSLIAEFLSANK